MDSITTKYTPTNIQQKITEHEIENMPWTGKCKLISKDPGTCSRYFNNRVQKFFKHILKSPYSPLVY